MPFAVDVFFSGAGEIPWIAEKLLAAILSQPHSLEDVLLDRLHQDFRTGLVVGAGSSRQGQVKIVGVRDYVLPRVAQPYVTAIGLRAGRELAFE